MMDKQRLSVVVIKPPSVHLDSSGFIWIHLDSSGFIWIHLDSSGFIWIHLDSSGFIWIHLDSLHDGICDFGEFENVGKLAFKILKTIFPIDMFCDERRKYVSFDILLNEIRKKHPNPEDKTRFGGEYKKSTIISMRSQYD